MRAEAELQRLLEFERLVSALSAIFLSRPPNHTDAAISQALRAIGEFTRADRSYLFQFSADRSTMSNTHEWCAEGIAPEIDNLQGLPLEAFPWGPQKLFRGEVINIPNVADLPPEAEAERQELQRQAIQSLILVPLLLGEQVLGFVGFDAVRSRQSWSDEKVAVLQVAAELFVNALQRAQAEERIQYLAYHDSLTGLPNRALLLDRLEQALAQAQRHRRNLALLFIDLDRFKTINDTLGHAVGDALLRQVAVRLSSVLREEDTVSRLGGDEFVILLPNTLVARDAAYVAEKVIGALSQSFVVEDYELHVSASIGISVYPRDGDDKETLIKHADLALYRAKDMGRDNYQLFNPEMNTQAHERLMLENVLRHAIARDQLVLYYQPLVEFERGAVTGVEALLRWQHPDRGLVPPGVFIPIAEETGMIMAISEWALRAACAQARAWQAMGLPHFRLAVNLSPCQFLRDDLPRLIAEILKETALAPACLELEITESSLMHDVPGAIKTLRALDEMGVQIAIDDFGTGYSSLGYLKRFSLHRLKIDSSFVQDLPHDEDAVVIVQAILAMAHQLKMKVTAEGVETREQLMFLKARQCDEVQGYIISKPLPPEALPALFGKC